MQQPKNITKNFKFRNIPYGNDRRVMAAKAVADHQPHFPKAVGYADIDQSMCDWVEKDLDISYAGKRMPTYKLFSTQRLAEYVQNWQSVDEKGNLDLNFKTITREINPQHGEQAGNYYNIPGERDYVLYKTYVQEEKGDEVVQIYSMKQPFAVNLIYTVSIITTSLIALNEMNNKVLNEFKALERYIFPNNHAMPMELNSVSDESEYTVDDRKYYAQNYQIKVMAYIINESDFKVTKMRSRMRNNFIVGQNSRNKIKKEAFNIESFVDNENKLVIETVNNNECIEVAPVNIGIQHNDNIEEEIYTEPVITIEECKGEQICWPDTEYEIVVQRKVIFNIEFSPIKTIQEFTIDCDLEVETLTLNNLKGYEITINGELYNFEDADISFKTDDKLQVKAVIKNPLKKASMSIVCFDRKASSDEDINVDIN